MSTNCDLNIPLTSNPTEIMLANAINDLRRLVYSPTFLQEIINRPTTNVKKGTTAPGTVGDKKWIDTMKVGNQFVVKHIGPDLTVHDRVGQTTVDDVHLEDKGDGSKELIVNSEDFSYDSKGHIIYGAGSTSTFRIPLSWVNEATGVSVVTPTAGARSLDFTTKDVLVFDYRAGAPISLSLVAISAITSWQVDDTNAKIQYKKTKFYCLAAEAEDNNWTDYDGTTCPTTTPSTDYGSF